MLFNAHLALVAMSMVAGAAHLYAGETIAENTNIVIGLLLPPEEAEGASLRDGATLAVELANQSSASRASLVIRGRTGQWGADGVEAARMVTDDSAQGLIAPPDGAATHLVLQVSGRTAVPVVSLCADSSVSQAGIPWMVRIVPCTVEEAKTLFAGIHARHWTALIPDGRAGREVARDLKAAAAAGGCSIENMIEVKPSFTNMALLCKQILTNRPDAIVLWMDSRMSGTLVKSLRAAGFAGTFAGPGRLRSADFEMAAGDTMEGLVVSGPILEKAAAAAFRLFATAFRERFGHEPDAMAAMSYDAAALLIHILRQAGGHPTPETFPINFSFTGASGILTFDSKGNRKANLELYKAHGRRFFSAGTESNP